MESLHQFWVVLKNIAKILFQSRFSLIIVLITVVSLQYVGQIKDILVGLNYPKSELQICLFILSVNWLAFQSWGWARYIYNRSQPTVNQLRGEAGYQRFLIDWLPRIYAMVAFTAAFFAARRANVNGVANGIVVVAIVVLAILYFRRNIVEIMKTKMTLPSGVWGVRFTLAVMLISAALAIYSPVKYGAILGAGAVVFLGLGSIIPVGTLLINAARENGFPVVGGLLFLAVIFSPLNDNHHVREIQGQKSNTKVELLDESLKRWMAQSDKSKPMVLVATAGGGLRASYWTGVVLGRLQDQIPEFNKQIFAVSGVSGGSVGAVFYNGALAAERDCKTGDNCFEENLLNAIGQDYLAATATSMLYGDLIQRFLPFAIFDDRAQALEQSWEVGFRRIYPNAKCGLDNSFTDFYSTKKCVEKQWLPRLLINGTYEESGRRLLTTSVRVDPSVFLDTHDFYQLNDQQAIRASTAALNSARFSYVSPAGTFGDDIGHVIDGGYFENYGANTLTNLIDWLRNHDKNPLANGLIVVAISNDSSIPLEQYRLDVEPDDKNAQNFLNEVLAPVLGLANTREGHGMLAYKQLAQFIDQIDKSDPINTNGPVEMVHFYLSCIKGREPAPLGWILSEESKKNMQSQILEAHNYLGYSEIMALFGTEPSAKIESERCRH